MEELEFLRTFSVYVKVTAAEVDGKKRVSARPVEACRAKVRVAEPFHAGHVCGHATIREFQVSAAQVPDGEATRRT